MNPDPLPERDHTPPADLVAILTEIVDATMPGRRIGSAPPEDCAPAALALLASVLPATLPDHLGLSSVHAWLAQHGQRTDERFARAFRRQAILARMRAASPLDPPPEPVLMPEPQPIPGYACPNGCGCALAHPAEPCPCCDVDGAVLLVSDEGEHNSADAPPPCPCRAAQNCHAHCPCPCHRQSGLPGAPLPPSCPETETQREAAADAEQAENIDRQSARQSHAILTAEIAELRTALRHLLSEARDYRTRACYTSLETFRRTVEIVCAAQLGQ
jgi:hypothetical protein